MPADFVRTEVAEGGEGWIWGGKLFIINYLCRSKIHTEGEGHEKENRERGGGKRKEKGRNEEGKHPARIVEHFSSTVGTSF